MSLDIRSETFKVLHKMTQESTESVATFADMLASVERLATQDNSPVHGIEHSLFSYYKKFFYRAIVNLDTITPLTNTPGTLYRYLHQKIDAASRFKRNSISALERMITTLPKIKGDNNRIIVAQYYKAIHYALQHCNARLSVNGSNRNNCVITLYFQDANSFNTFLNYDSFDHTRFIFDYPDKEEYIDALKKGFKLSKDDVDFKIRVRSGYEYVDYNEWIEFVDKMTVLSESGSVKLSKSRLFNKEWLKSIEPYLNRKEHVWLPNVYLDCADESTYMYVKLIIPVTKLFTSGTTTISVNEVRDVDAPIV